MTIRALPVVWLSGHRPPAAALRIGGRYYDEEMMALDLRQVLHRS